MSAVATPDRLSVAEAARCARVTREHIRGLLARGVLDGIKVGEFWAIDAASLEKWEAAGRPSRRPLEWTSPRLPVAPILQLIAARGGAAACGVEPGGALAQILRQARAEGRTVTLWDGDRLAVELFGLTPLEVWGPELWFQGLPKVACGASTGSMRERRCFTGSLYVCRTRRAS